MNTGSSSTNIVPDTDVLLEALRQCQATHGESTALEKLHRVMKDAHPDWQFSVDRLRKLRREAGLAPSPYPDLIQGPSETLFVEQFYTDKRRQDVASRLVSGRVPNVDPLRKAHIPTTRHLLNRRAGILGDSSPSPPVVPRTAAENALVILGKSTEKTVPMKVIYNVLKRDYPAAAKPTVTMEFEYRFPKGLCWARTEEHLKENISAAAPYVDAILDDIAETLVAQGSWVCSARDPEECSKLAKVFCPLTEPDIQCYPIPVLEVLFSIPVCKEYSACSGAAFRSIQRMACVRTSPEASCD